MQQIRRGGGGLQGLVKDDRHLTKNCGSEDLWLIIQHPEIFPAFRKNLLWPAAFLTRGPNGAEDLTEKLQDKN